jgi:hypothetical protein
MQATPDALAERRPAAAASLDAPLVPTLTPLIRDMLGWLAAGPRPYAEVLDAWRTSCPRLTVWEDAVDAGLVACTSGPGRSLLVEVTPRGRAPLAAPPR